MLNGQNLSWTNVRTGVPQGSFLGLLFLICINNSSENLNSNVQLFADESLFSVFHDVNTAAEELSDDFKSS